MLELAYGILHLHNKNITHRDLKPENILLVDGCFKISDFGLAKVFENDLAMRSQVGTPTYLAPEIL